MFINRLSPFLYKMKAKALKVKVSCNEQNTEKHISGMKSYGLCFFRLFRITQLALPRIARESLFWVGSFEWTA